jgi:hypothetical protein
MKKLYFILLLFPFFGFSQNACKKCSNFSTNNNWSKLILCISDEIKKTENINDYMCRVQCFGAIFQKTDSILFSLDSSKKYYSKKDVLILTVNDLNVIIQKDSLFANGIPFKQLQHIEKLLNEY